MSILDMLADRKVSNTVLKLVDITQGGVTHRVHSGIADRLEGVITQESATRGV